MQSMVTNVRVEAVRNIDKLPTLAGMDAQHLPTLLKQQEEALQRLMDTEATKGKKMSFSEIVSMEKAAKDQLRKDLMAKGLDLLTDDGRIKKDRHYSSVVQQVTDDQRLIHMSDDGSFMLMVNFPYEQFRFVVNKPGGSVEEAIRLMQSGIEAVKGDGKVHFGMLSTKSWLCCNLNNLGGFQIRLTLSLPENEDINPWFAEIQELFKTKFGPDQIFLQRSKENTNQVFISSRFQLGRKATEHITKVTNAAKEGLGIYKAKVAS